MEKVSRQRASIECLGICVLSTLILYERCQDRFLNPQLWAEDGPTFLAQQRELGYGSFLKEYAGYYHLIQRLVSYIVGFFSLSYTPALYTYAALCIFLFVSSFIYFHSKAAGLNGFYCGLIPALTPHGGEIYLNLTNIQWVTALCIPFIYLRSLQNWRHAIGYSFLILLIGLTGPFVLLSSPLFAIKFVWLKHKFQKYDFVLLFFLVVASVLQAQSLLASPGGSAINSEANILTVYVKNLMTNFGENLFFGTHSASVGLSLFQGISLSQLISVSLLAATFVIALYWLRNSQMLQVCAVVFLLYALPIYFLSLYKTLTVEGVSFVSGPSFGPFSGGQRYFYIPYVLMLMLYAIFTKSDCKSIKNMGLICSILILAVSVRTFHSIPPRQDFGWSNAVEKLQQQCAVEVPIPPSQSFTFTLYSERSKCIGEKDDRELAYPD